VAASKPAAGSTSAPGDNTICVRAGIRATKSHPVTKNPGAKIVSSFNKPPLDHVPDSTRQQAGAGGLRGINAGGVYPVRAGKKNSFRITGLIADVASFILSVSSLQQTNNIGSP
jgi:hypothetical protein